MLQAAGITSHIRYLTVWKIHFSVHASFDDQILGINVHFHSINLQIVIIMCKIFIASFNLFKLISESDLILLNLVLHIEKVLIIILIEIDVFNLEQLFLIFLILNLTVLLMQFTS